MARAPRGRRRWRRRHALALAVGAVAVVAPVACAAGAALVVSVIVPRPPGAAMLAWWALVAVVAAMIARCCRPVAERARTLATLLDLRVEFPYRATSRVRIAAASSSATMLQRRLVSTDRGAPPAVRTTRRMATAAALGAFKQQRDTHPNPVHAPSAVLAGLALVFVGLTVSTGISSPPARETAAPAAQQPPITIADPQPQGALPPLVGTPSSSIAVGATPTQAGGTDDPADADDAADAGAGASAGSGAAVATNAAALESTPRRELSEPGVSVSAEQASAEVRSEAVTPTPTPTPTTPTPAPGLVAPGVSPGPGAPGASPGSGSHGAYVPDREPAKTASEEGAKPADGGCGDACSGGTPHGAIVIGDAEHHAPEEHAVASDDTLGSVEHAAVRDAA